MLSTRKLQLLLAFTTLFSLAWAVGCRGFFQDPQLYSITVVLNNVTAITISPNSANAALGSTTTTFTCSATVSGGPPVDVTSSVDWTVTDSTGAAAANISISNRTNPATVTVNSNAATGTYTVNASYTTNSQTFTDTATLTVP